MESSNYQQNEVLTKINDFLSQCSHFKDDVEKKPHVPRYQAV